MEQVDGWSPSGVMQALSTRARAMQNEMAENRAWNVRVNHRDPEPAGVEEQRLGRLAALTRQAAEAMDTDEPDLEILDGVCCELAIWCDGHDRRSMDLAETLITKAARLTVDRFDLMRAGDPGARSRGLHHLRPVTAGPEPKGEGRGKRSNRPSCLTAVTRVRSRGVGLDVTLDRIQWTGVPAGRKGQAWVPRQSDGGRRPLALCTEDALPRVLPVDDLEP